MRQLGEGQQDQHDLGRQDVHAQDQRVGVDQAVIGQPAGEHDREDHGPDQIILDRADAPLHRVRHAMHQGGDQRDQGDGGHQADHRVGQRRPGQTGQAFDQCDMRQEEQQRHQKTDVPDPADHHVEGRALEGARIRHGAGEHGPKARPPLTGARLGEVLLAPEHEDLGDAHQQTDREDGDRDVEHRTLGPQQKLHRAAHSLASNSSTVTG